MKYLYSLRILLLSSVLVFLSIPIGAGESTFSASVDSSVFGQIPDGQEVHLFTLTNKNGLEIKVMTYGATLISVKTPDRKGQVENITLYLDTFEDYLKGHPLFGSVVGRYANRIAGARFFLDAMEYAVTPNAGKNHIHGGPLGFQKIVWEAKTNQEDGRVSAVLSHTSPAGHEGYPGNLDVTVTYSLTDEDELIMRYTAKSDEPTHVNLTNHAYWNLSGAGSGNILDHVMHIHADHYLPSDKARIPTGEIKSVVGTPMDFREPHTIGSRIEEVEGENYDHCYVLNKKEPNELSLCATVYDPQSGRMMEVYTTQPGVQFYTAKGLNARLQGGGKPYGPYHGFCLETQHFPDSPNRSYFPTTILRPDEQYEETTVHKFSVKQ